MTTQLQERKATVNPKKFSLWLLLLGILMLFSGLTSAYIVRKGDGNWFDFELPPIFMYSTIIVLLSSLTIYSSSKGPKPKSLDSFHIAFLVDSVIIPLNNFCNSN